MATYPIAPSALKRSWNDKHSEEFDIISDRRNGGIELRTNAYNINTLEDSWSLSLAIKSKSDKDAIDNFFSSQDGKPFWFEGRLYSVSEHSWSWESPETWKLSVNLEHSHRTYTGLPS